MKRLKCQVLIWLALLTIFLSSAAFSNDYGTNSADPDTVGKIQVIAPGQWFQNTSKQDYFAWPRSTHEKAYVRIKLSYDLQNEVNKNDLQITFWKIVTPLAFIAGLVTGVYLAK